MRQTRLSLFFAICAFAFSHAAAQTDVTAQYVTNPSFESDDITALTAKTETADGLRGYPAAAPAGWTVSNGVGATSLIVTADCYTDNNFGLVTTLSDGTQAYYQRVGWTSGASSMKQTLSGLAAGSYRLSIDYRSAYANSAASGFELYAATASTTASFSQGSAGCFTTMAWQTATVDFEMAEAADVEIGVSIAWSSGGSCVMFDNVRLLQLPDDYVAPEEPTEADIASPTEGTVLADFVAEAQMQADLLQMLANFATYLKNDFQDCAAPNSADEACGCFKGESTMASNEAGVRTNADLSMICAFLVKYGKGSDYSEYSEYSDYSEYSEYSENSVTLPEGVTWDDLEAMAMKSLVFAYSTHKANKLKTCSGGDYWGSTAVGSSVWESSLWAMSVAYSAAFQWDKLTEAQKGYVYEMLKAECNYELNRTIPTGYSGDTKAEENGWEADVLAATLGLFPNDELAPQWFQRLRQFAINSYSHKDDAGDQTVIDPDYDQTTVSDLYLGQNLYDDYTLQNHNYFHTSYQNVVMQELGEAALALKLFQQLTNGGTERWKTNALMHNNQQVMDHVLNWLALADGELAMPNGNDWSLFLYDQITSYSTNACFLRDPNALMLENLAYKQIKARQQTTQDGSWLLRPDVGARRMGVEAHRVMMTWLMHNAMSTADLTPTTWPAFLSECSRAKVFPSQNIVRAATDSRFTCFSWSKGLSSYTGYIAANSVDKNKIVVPFRANNTGNFLGWYEVSGKATNATPVLSGSYQLDGNAWVMNGELNTNDATLNNRFVIYSTPGNAVIYMDNVRAKADATITAEKGGLMAISVDELTKTTRTLYTTTGHTQTDGTTLKQYGGDWLNVDNALGIVAPSNASQGAAAKQFAFGERANNNSIMTARLYSSYSNESRSVTVGSDVDRRAIVYYSGVTAEETARLSTLTTQLPASTGWNAVIAADPAATVLGGSAAEAYFLLANFNGASETTLTNVKHNGSAPVLPALTTITAEGSTATFTAGQNSAIAAPLRFFISGCNLQAKPSPTDDTVIFIENQSDAQNAFTLNGTSQTLAANAVMKASLIDGGLLTESAPGGLPAGTTDITPLVVSNADFTGGTAIDNHVTGYQADASKAENNTPYYWQQPVKGWQNGVSNADGKAGAVFAYGSTHQLRGNRLGAPATNPDGGTTGQALGLVAVWSATVQYVQPIELPAGEYIMTVPVYNAGGTASVPSKSLIGFIEADGTEHLASPSVYRVGEWTTETVTFTLSETTLGSLSLGYTSGGGGSANAPHLFIDRVELQGKMTKGTPNYLNDMKEKVEAFISDENRARYVCADDDLATLTSALAGSPGETTMASVIEGAQTLRKAGFTFLDAITLNEGETIDLTAFVRNAGFDADNAVGWTYDNAPAFQTYSNAEYYQKTFDISQTVSGLPAGKRYTVKVQAFQRPGSNADAWTAYDGSDDPTANVTAELYVGSESQNVKNIMSETTTKSGITGSTQVGTGLYVPNNMASARTFFDMACPSAPGGSPAETTRYYDNALTTTADADGTLTFGLRCATSATGYWNCFDNFRLLYAGDPLLTLSETETPTLVAQKSFVTLERPFSAGWNTLCLPFDVKADMLQEQLGDDVEVYEFTGYDSETGTLTFTRSTLSVGNPVAIEAGKPYVVKVSADKTSTKYNGVTVVTDAPAPTVFGGVSFTGNYEYGMSMEGKYGIKTDGSIALGTSTATLRGFRAYFSVAEGSNVRQLNAINFGGETTGIAKMEDGRWNIENGTVYDLQGRRMESSILKKGLYIVHGKKVVVR